MPTFKQSIALVVVGAGLLVLGHFFKDLDPLFLPTGGGLLMAANLWNRRSQDPPPPAPK